MTPLCLLVVRCPRACRAFRADWVRSLRTHTHTHASTSRSTLTPTLEASYADCAAANEAQALRLRMTGFVLQTVVQLSNEFSCKNLVSPELQPIASAIADKTQLNACIVPHINHEALTSLCWPCVSARDFPPTAPQQACRAALLSAQHCSHQH